jgi:UPF0271 protein
MGYRLQGEVMRNVKEQQLLSSAVTRGTIQLLPSGQLIILMADHQTTGGYPKIAHVISADLSRLAQVQPNERLEFELITHQEAEDALIRQQEFLQETADSINSQLQQYFTDVSIDLNCDMGEGMPNDAALMRFISSANIACGYHAGNEGIMKKTAELALENNVAIGAHPGFADKENFGRVESQLQHDEYYALIIQQLAALKKITDTLGAKIHHVKPHGALYNISAKDKNVASILSKAIKDFDENLIVYGLSGSYSISEAQALHLKTASEVFADRTYQNNGSLTPRSQPHALIEDENMSSKQVLQMIQEQTVTSLEGKRVSIIAETICIHGDGVHAVEFAGRFMKR